MKSLLTIITAIFVTTASSQGYGSGSSGSSGQGSSGSGSGPVVTSCPTQFAISSFSASCIRHGTGCQFSFNVATNESLSSSVTCSASFPNVAMELPLVPYTLCTDDDNIVWGWAPIGPPNGSATAYSLIITDTTVGLMAAKLWDATDFPMTTAGATIFQNYTGEASFDI